MNPTKPSNEQQRLAALESLNVLDSASEAAFDEIAELASQICQTPIALVSLVDRDRQWFKSHHGLDATQTAREVAFCAHAINEPAQLLEVEDATRDPRFANNPLVTGDPSIRFYAGAPLISADGYALGTLCVIDRKPHLLNEGQRNALKILSRQVSAQLELRKRTADSRNKISNLILLRELDVEQRDAMLTAGLDLKAFIDRDFVYQFVNPVYLDYWKKGSDEIVGKTVSALMGDERFQQLRPQLERCLQGESVTYESAFDFPGKGRRYMNAAYIPARNASNEIIGIVVRVHDIDHLKRTEENLRASVSRLLEFTENQQQFIYALSHDLREPINTIINFSSLLGSDFAHELSPPAKSFTAYISSGALRMKALLDDLIQYVSLEKADHDMQECNLELIVKNVLTDLTDNIERNKAKITVSKLPIVIGRASSMQLLMQNLIANAIKFHAPGVTPEVEISTETRDNEWQISVKDNGIGIEEELQPKLFQAFHRLNSPKEFSGSGLGLMMVKKIVEKHGGRVWIESKKGEGTRVIATIAKRSNPNLLPTTTPGGA